jgi:hypothetical protein
MTKKVLLFIFWTVLIVSSFLFFLDDAVGYFVGYRNPRFGETLFSNQLWFVLHMAGATCSLFLGPIQFWKSVRIKFPRVHRILGKIYVTAHWSLQSAP